MKFRLPRKIKKKLTRKMFFYPSDKDGNSLVGYPTKNQEDYNAYKQGILRQPFKFTKAERKAKSIAWDKKFRQPCELSDKELVEAVNSVFAQEYREDAINTFRRAKNHPIAIEDYHIFCNAIKHTQNGDDCSITACMLLDGAKDNLMRSKPRKK